MRLSEPVTPEDFWAFSLAVYAKPGVAPLCLALQDQWQLDVNLLLFCLHAGHQGRALTATDLLALHAAAAPWRDHVVHPLRAVRRWLTSQADDLATEPVVPRAVGATALRQQTQAAELAAERCQQLAMAHAVTLAPGLPSRHVAASNLVACANGAPSWPDAALLSALGALTDAVFAPDCAPARPPP